MEKSKTKVDYKSTYARHRFQIIRNHARRKAELFNWEKKCKVCGYTKHVHLCHLKAIHTFSDTALLAEINHHENIVYLCPTHHWEQEHGLLTL
jgi:predicted restriction endonuclease